MTKSFIQLGLIGLIVIAGQSYATENNTQTANKPARVYCPLCENIAPSFMPGGNKFKRHNSHCIKCGCKERQRHLWLLLQYHYPQLFSAQDNVIEWNLGTDNMLRPARTPSFQVIHFGADKSMARILFARYNINYICADAINDKRRSYSRTISLTSTEFDDDSQDIILLDHALQMVQNDTEALAEMYRILKPRGTLYIQIPVYNDLEKTFEDPSISTDEERHKHFNQSDHVRKYGTDVLERIQHAGFTVGLARLTDIPKKDREYYGLDGYDDDPIVNAARGADIYICIKE